jgi:hypothetical protein
VQRPSVRCPGAVEAAEEAEHDGLVVDWQGVPQRGVAIVGVIFDPLSFRSVCCGRDGRFVVTG